MAVSRITFAIADLARAVVALRPRVRDPDDDPELAIDHVPDAPAEPIEVHLAESDFIAVVREVENYLGQPMPEDSTYLAPDGSGRGGAVRFNGVRLVKRVHVGD